MLIQLYSDAATDFKQQTNGAGLLILQAQKQIQLHQPLPKHLNNHQAEFQAAIWAFQQLLEICPLPEQTAVQYFTDSRLVSDSIAKEYAKQYAPELSQLLALQDYFKVVITQWIPDRSNQGAHQQALQGLHQN